MGLLEISLIVIGVIIIFISIRLIDDESIQKDQKLNNSYTLKDSHNIEEFDKVKHKFENMLTEISEEMIEKTDQDLSNISNEKIIAINDFSNQILEKIHRNHEEVVFLYSMLNEKEKELKTLIKEVDSTKRKHKEDSVDKMNDGNEKILTLEKGSMNTKLVKELEQHKLQKSKDELKSDSSTYNNNSEILALHAKGKSVVEISKLLGLGQGEVKLVIDLFQGH